MRKAIRVHQATKEVGTRVLAVTTEGGGGCGAELACHAAACSAKPRRREG